MLTYLLPVLAIGFGLIAVGFAGFLAFCVCYILWWALQAHLTAEPESKPVKVKDARAYPTEDRRIDWRAHLVDLLLMVPSVACVSVWLYAIVRNHEFLPLPWILGMALGFTALVRQVRWDGIRNRIKA